MNINRIIYTALSMSLKNVKKTYSTWKITNYKGSMTQHHRGILEYIACNYEHFYQSADLYHTKRAYGRYTTIFVGSLLSWMLFNTPQPNPLECSMKGREDWIVRKHFDRLKSSKTIIRMKQKMYAKSFCFVRVVRVVEASGNMFFFGFCMAFFDFPSSS